MTLTEPGMDLVQAPAHAMSVEEARSAMQVYRQMCESLLEPEDFQAIGDNKFTKRSGFQKLAAAYGVSTEIVKRELIHDDEGLLRCDVVVRATHPNGRFAEGDGACSRTERRFRRGAEKIDHDLPATATTRAMNRAVSNLVAFGTMSAEEAEGSLSGGGPATAASLPGWAAAMTDIPGVAHNIQRVLEAAGVEDTADRTQAIGQEIFNLCDGTFPFALARLAHLMAKAAEQEEVDGETVLDPEDDAAQSVEQQLGDTTTTDGKDAA